MRCTNKGFRKSLLSFGLILTVAMSLCGCANSGIPLKYDAYNTNSSFTINSGNSARKASPFAEDLCVAEKNINESRLDFTEVGAAALFSLDDKEVLYAKNVHQTMYPASLTKVMTALVALELGNRDDMLTASQNVIINESGAQLCGLKPGDTMTLDQALRILLLYSANDVAIMISEHYGETVENFCSMMNEEAKRIGATNCNFVNPNGLTDEEHYITAYDMYLIFREACKYDLFKEIISMSSYNTIYHDAGGGEISFEKPSTNRFVNGDADAPAGITVIGGKTGTTAAAGHCLVLLTSDTKGKSYISIILKSTDTGLMYDQMKELLGTI